MVWPRFLFDVLGFISSIVSRGTVVGWCMLLVDYRLLFRVALGPVKVKEGGCVTCTEYNQHSDLLFLIKF